MRNSDEAFYKTKAWELTRERVLRRDGYKCKECYRYGILRSGSHVHHIFPREVFPQWSFETWNMITLCQKCHNEMHVRDGKTLTAKGRDLARRTARAKGIDLDALIKTAPLENGLK